MHRRLLVVMVAFFALFALSPAAASPLAASQCFSVPGITNCIDGRFGSFWNDNGGLPVFGYPIGTQHAELNRDDVKADPNNAKLRDTQWFERNRFEQHPENMVPYDVLLGRLGAERLQAQSRDWHNEPNNGNPLGGSCQHFNDTNRDVCGPFLTYWKGHGLQDPKLDTYNRSLQLFGLPLTGVKPEKNSNGDTVMTQWFERARFELHPEAGNVVLLGLLGKEQASPGGSSGVSLAAAGENIATTLKGGSSELTVYGITPDSAHHRLIITYEVALPSQITDDVVQHINDIGDLAITRAVVDQVNAGAQIDNVVFDLFILGELHADNRFVPTSAMLAWSRKEISDPLYFHDWVHVDDAFGEAPPPPAPIPSGTRLGAICRDGTTSTATGSGACSHHGGVDHWIIAP